MRSSPRRPAPLRCDGYQKEPAHDHRQGLEGARLPSPVVGAVLSIQQNFVRGGFDIVTGDVERLGARKPRELRALLASALGGWLRRSD